MDQGGWYIARADTQSGPHQSATLQKALISGQVVPSDQIWREGMDGWETAKVFLWFAKQGQANQPAPNPAQAAAPVPEPAPTTAAAEVAPAASAAETQQRPTPKPPGGDGALGKLEQPEKKFVAEILGHAVSVSEGDLADFAAPNAEPYLAYRQKLLNKGGKFRFSWWWPASVVPFAWLAYRRIYDGLVCLVLYAVASGIVEHLFPDLRRYFYFADLGIFLTLSMTAKPFMLIRANQAAALADELQLTGRNRSYFLTLRGGVSRVGGWIGGVASALIFLYLTLSAVSAFFGLKQQGWFI
jgi:hypothetical protein